MYEHVEPGFDVDVFDRTRKESPDTVVDAGGESAMNIAKTTDVLVEVDEDRLRTLRR